MATSFKMKFGKKSSMDSQDNISLGSSTSSSSSNAAVTETHRDKDKKKQHPALLDRMSKKIAKITKFGREREDWQSQIDDLEKLVEETERDKKCLEKQLEESGRRCEERGEELEQLTVNITDLQNQLSVTKVELQCRECEHEKRLRILKEDHGRRIDSLESLHRQELARIAMSDDADLEAKLAELEALYKNQIEELSARCSQAVTGLAELNDGKLLSQTLSEADIKLSDNLSSQLIRQVEVTETKDENDDQRLAPNQIEEMRAENEACRREKRELEEKMAGLNVVIDENSLAIVSLSVQIAELRDEVQREQEEVQECKNQLFNQQTANQKLTDEINAKNETICQLEEQGAELRVNVDNMTAEMDQLKSKLQSVNDQIQTTDKRHKHLMEEKDREFEVMQNLYTKTLEDRKSVQEKYEKEFEFLRNCHQEREQQMMEDFEWKLREIQKSSKSKQEELKNVQKKLKSEYEDLVNKKDVHAETLCKQIEENDDKINITEAELRQLRGFTEELQKDMKIAASQVDQMRMLEIRFREELRDTRAHLVDSKDTMAKLQKELSDTKASCERRLKAKDVNLKKTLDEQVQILTQQWNIKLDKELKRRAEELEVKYNNLKLSALEELALQKDQEIASLMNKYESKTTELIKQLKSVTTQLELRERQLTDEIELIKMTSNLKVTEAQKILDMKSEDLNKMELEMKGKEKQIEELHTQLQAHRTTLDIIKEDAVKQTESEIQKFKRQHENQLEGINGEWEEKMSNALEAQSQSHKMQIQNARIELEKLMQISKSKELEQLGCISELKEAVSQREISIKRLNEEMQRLQKGLAKMSQELEFHGREILRVKNEASRQLRAASDGPFNHVKHTEDKTAIKQLREAVLDKDRMVKKLQDEKKILFKQLEAHMTNYKRLSSSQPVVNSPSINEAKVVKRSKKSKECPNRLSAPVIMAEFEGSPTANDKNTISP